MRKQENNYNQNSTDDDSRIEYKEHSEFFETYYQLRNKTLMYFSLTRTNPSNMIKLIDSLSDLFRWTNAQLNAITDIKEIRSELNKLYILHKNNEINKCFSSCENFFDLLSSLQMDTELIPKVKTQDNRDITKEDDPRFMIATAAFNLIYPE